MAAAAAAAAVGGGGGGGVNEAATKGMSRTDPLQEDPMTSPADRFPDGLSCSSRNLPAGSTLLPRYVVVIVVVINP